MWATAIKQLVRSTIDSASGTVFSDSPLPDNSGCAATFIINQSALFISETVELITDRFSRRSCSKDFQIKDGLRMVRSISAWAAFPGGPVSYN